MVITIEEIQKIAQKKGGKCLSEIYVNSKKKIKLQCKEGHTWKSRPSHIKEGRWCPFCANFVKLTIGEMQNIAKSRNGKCLSESYTNSHTKLKWQCKEGHIWYAKPSHIKGGTWCPYCQRRKITIEELQEIAKSRNGKCLSENYSANQTKLKWQCSKGHIWEAVPSSVKYGCWCPYCSHHVSLTIEAIHKMAEDR
ncbi:MAG: hypothetical protein NT120_00435, partial [Candidatus Aenigmarchaeota archaeon]|nr:hypothetical protein [Candidatus Aenigmarchaeota archaeon]